MNTLTTRGIRSCASERDSRRQPSGPAHSRNTTDAMTSKYTEVMLMRVVTAAVTCVLLLTGLAWAAPDDHAPPPFSPEYERKVGEETVAKVETEYKPYQDDEANAKLTAMTAEIAAATTRPDVKYEIHLLDTDEVNAFSVPGGFIFVTKGLLDEVQSDDELAGVLAHEIAHNCTYDALIQAERNKDLFTGSVAAAIAAILLGASSSQVSTVLIAGEFVRRGVLGGYSLNIERMADQHGAESLLKTHYNPVGLLTFMERLAAKERREVPRDLGVYQTHPLATERVRWLVDLLDKAGVEINRRATTKWDPPKAEEVEVDGKKGAKVSLWGEDLFLVLTPGPDYESPMQRAEAIVKTLTGLLAGGMERYELHIGEREGNPALLAEGEAIVVVYPEDAQAAGAEADKIVADVSKALRRALVKESLDRLY